MPKTKKQIHLYTFDSVEELLADIEAYDAEHGVPEGYHADVVGRRRRQDQWRGGIDFEGALTLYRDGWLEGARKAKASGLAATPNARGGKSYRLDVAGGRPCPARAAAGDPMNMRRKGNRRGGSRPVVRFAAPLGARAGVGPKQLENTGFALAAACDAIEQSGKALELYASSIARSSSDKLDVIILIKLKDAAQPMDIERVTFALAHPAFFRHIIFDILSRKANGELGSGLGRPVSLSIKALDAEGFDVHDMVMVQAMADNPDTHTPAGAAKHVIKCLNEAAKETLLTVEDIQVSGSSL